MNETIHGRTFPSPLFYLRKLRYLHPSAYYGFPDTFDLPAACIMFCHDLTRLNQLDIIFFQQIGQDKIKSHYQYAGRFEKISTLSE